MRAEAEPFGQAQGVAEIEAEACFLQAIEVARQQSARSWELRAVMSLCCLWRKQGKREEARKRPAEIYGWFTEGFDTADLREAKALLEEELCNRQQIQPLGLGQDLGRFLLLIPCLL